MILPYQGAASYSAHLAPDTRNACGTMLAVSRKAAQRWRADTGPSVSDRAGLFARCAPWGAIVLLALGLRFVYLLQIQSIPFFTTPVGDAAAYDAWASRIASGDWFGSEAFYQAPAYPYFLAVVYRLLGRDMFTLRLVQAFMGAGSCLLLGLAGSRFFSRRVGIIAAIVLAMYPPAIFFDGLIQKTSLGLLLMSALLWWLSVASAHPHVWRWLLMGVLLGLFGLTRENALVLAVVLLGWIWSGGADLGWRPHGYDGAASDAARDAGRPLPHGRGSVRWRRSGRGALVCSAALIAGLVLTLGPVAYRNHRTGGVWAITTVQAGPNFYIGNHAGATGRYTPLVKGHESPPFERADAQRLAEQALGRELSDKEVSRYWLGRSWEFIRGAPLDWLILSGKKLLLVFNDYEITDTEGFNVYRDYSPLLGTLAALLHFGVLCPLAAAGIVLAWSDRRRWGVLWVMALALAVSVAAFYVFSRYRFPLVPLAILFAAAALAEGAVRLRHRDGNRLAGPAVALILGAVVCNLPLNPTRELDAMAHGNLGSVLAQRGDVAAAAEIFRIALVENPDAPELHYNLGLACRVMGDYPQAISSLLAAQRLDPTLIEVDYQLGTAYEATGDKPAALKHYRRALELNADDRDSAAAIERLMAE